MSQTYTGNILLTIQGIDNVAVATLFNHAVTNTSNPANADVQFTSIAALSSATTIIAGVALGIYVKNIGTAALTVAWNNGTANVNVVVLPTGAFILMFQNTGTGPISNVILTPASATAVEYAIWA